MSGRSRSQRSESIAASGGIRRSVVDYCVAGLAVVLAVLLRWLLNPVLDHRLPFITFFGAVAIAVWFGGSGPALFAALLGFVAANQVFIETELGTPLSLGGVGGFAGLAVYLCSSLVIIGFGSGMRNAQRRAEAHAQETLARQQQLQQEVAQREAAEESLRQNEERFRSLVAVTTSVIWITDDAGRFVSQQPSWATYTGQTWKQYQGSGWESALHPDDRERVRRMWEKARQAKERYECDGRLWHAASNTYRRCEARSVPMVYADGSVREWVGMCLDVEDREHAQDQLRTAREQLQIVTDCMSAPVTRCSRELTYLWVSKPYADWLGRPTHEIVGRPIVEVLGQEAFQHLHPYFERVLSGETVRYEEMVNFRGPGNRWISAVYVPTYDAAGTPDGWVAVVIDIHHRKQAEEALEAADRRKDEFLATLGHELGNAFVPLRFGLELLERAGDDRSCFDTARTLMQRQLRETVQLIDDLRDISGIKWGKMQLRRERIALSAVVQSAVEKARPFIQESAHELTVALPSEAIYLNADANRLSQAFSNLLNNAAKYTERGGHIWLTAQRQDSEGIVSIRDTGIGIAAEHLPNLFDMFSQAAPAHERSRGGLGIGLSLVKRLVELHGGRVEAHSDGPGKGSEFIVRLPAAEGAAGA